MLRLVKAAQDEAGLPKSGVVGPGLMQELREADAFDAYGVYLLERYAATHPRVVYPTPAGSRTTTCQGLHQTAGLFGNWAIDFCAPPGTAVVAVEDAKIAKLSGSDPDDDRPEGAGVYGWSVHYATDLGYRYFLTHLGRRETLIVGQRVEAGDVLGWVGDQEFRPDHLHLGVTSPLGERDAKRRITAVSKAPKT
jgi:murein DD-endopeptidase MepM/ murein hydrolase activator NlpD